MHKKIGYVMILSGFMLCLVSAAGSDCEGLSITAVCIMAVSGIVLMVCGDFIRTQIVIPHKKRSARKTRSATSKQLNYTPKGVFSQGENTDV